IAIRVAEGCDRPAANEALNAEWLTVLVVDEIHGRELDEHRLAVAQLEFLLARAADDLLGRNAIDALGERANELHAAPRHDERLEAIDTQVGEQLEHRLIHQLGI